MRNCATDLRNAAASSCMRRAAAEASSTMAAFCWVDPSIWLMVWLTCSIPADCSCEAPEISAMMSVTPCTLATILPIVAPACRTRTDPSATLPTEVSMSPLIYLAAFALR